MSKDRTAVFAPAVDDDLSAVLAAYLGAVDRGDKPDRAALLAGYPHLAERLKAYFAAQDRLEQIAGPLRVTGEAEATCLAYELLEEIGRGGMGVVLRCRDGTLHRDLAIKVLLDRYRDRPDLVCRFIEEARITGQLQHPFIVPIHELGTLADGRPYFAMKLVQGRTFADLLQARPTPTQDLPRFLQVFEQISQTIAYAHSKGVIHRDLKPSNVMVGAFGEVQVMDWGLAKTLEANQPEVPATGAGSEAERGDAGSGPGQTEAGAILGTFAFMPPEQARGELQRVTRRSDVFGLGAILCEILTGAPPYVGDYTEVRAHARSGRTDEAVARLSGCGADAELLDLAQRCLAGALAERPADGAAVADAMARYFAAVRQRLRSAEIARAQAETEAVEERKRLVLAEAKAGAEQKRGSAERRRRRATVLSSVSLFLLLAVGMGGGFWYQQEQSTRAAEVAARRAVTERDVAAALTEVRLRHEEGLKQVDNPERWKLTLTGARDALKRAENALALGEASDELTDAIAAARALLDQDERDWQLFATLERLWLEASLLSSEDVRAPRNASAFLGAFKDYGLDLEALEPKEAAARIRAHRHRQRLMDEVNIVAYMQAILAVKPGQRTQQFSFRGVVVRAVDWSKADRLTRILDEVDADPSAFGTRWRAARANQDVAALLRLARSVEARKLSPRAVGALANDLVGIKAFDEARQLLRDGLERNPTDFSLNIRLGLVAAASFVSAQGGSLEESVRYLTASLAIRGNNAATHVLLAHVFMAQEKKDEALRAAQAAVAADPDSAPAHYTVGMLSYERREWDKALASYHKAAELDVVSPLPFDALGQTYYAKQNYDEAIRHYRIAIQRAPSTAGIHVNLGSALAATNDVDGSIEQYREALRLFPKYALAHHNLGLSLGQKNDIDGAESCFRAAVRCDPNHVPAHYSLGKLLLAYRRDAEGAIQCYQRAVDVYPKVANGHFQLADLLQGLGRHVQAEASLRKVIEIDPEYPEVQARLGIALAARRDWDGAVAAYRSALKQGKNGEQQAALHDYLGTALLNKGDFQGASASHQKALALGPTRANYSHNLGVAQMAMGDMEKAEESFRTALKHEPNNAVCHMQLAKVLLELRDLDGAIASAEAARKLAANFGAAYHVLAQAQWDKGDFVGGLRTIAQGQKLVAPSDPSQGLLRVDYQMGEEFLKGDKLLPAVLRGDAKPEGGAATATLAMICACKHQRYAAASQLFAAAFTDLPTLARDVGGGARFRAACCAARAGTGDAEKDGALDQSEQGRLRRQALDWLRADLDGWKHALTSAPQPEHGKMRFRVRCWLKEADLEKVRQPDRLQQLPAEERQAWMSLWADVAAFADASAQPKGFAGPDPVRLRKLADFPSVTTVFDINFQSSKVDSRGNLIDPVKKIAALVPQLKGSVADADIYLELAYYHGDLQEQAKSQEMAGKAEQWLRPFLKSSDPRDAHRLLTYAAAHAILYPALWQEQEQWVRRATELAPKDWRGWQRLGTHCLFRAQTTALGGRLPDPGKRNEAVELLLGGTASPKTLAEVEKLLEEARQCSDRARALAPTIELQWEHRIGYLIREADWINALRVARGKPPLAASESSPVYPELAARGFTGGKFSIEAAPDLLAECREAAERCPEHVGLQVFGLLTLLPRLKQRIAEREFAKDKRSPLFTPAETQFVDEALARVEQIGKKAGPEAARYCDRVLGCYHFQLAMLNDMAACLPRAESHVRRLVEADPKDQDAAEVLEFIVTEQGRLEAGLAIARKRLANIPSMRNRYLLARSLANGKQPEAALKELDAALKIEPLDPCCLAGRAVLLLRENESPDVWVEAGKCLDQARAAMKPGASKILSEDIEFAGAICQALTGRPILARVTLERLQSDNPRMSRYREALEALGP